LLKDALPLRVAFKFEFSGEVNVVGATIGRPHISTRSKHYLIRCSDYELHMIVGEALVPPAIRNDFNKFRQSDI